MHVRLTQVDRGARRRDARVPAAAFAARWWEPCPNSPQSNHGRTPMPRSTNVSKTAADVSDVKVEARNTFLLQLALGAIQPQSITQWEEIACIGYNPEMRRLEAIVNIKQSTGYNGGLCTNASREYVRFFVDFKDG